ncbi:Non-specific lipid-transfer protein Lac s 1 [Camellia lanceoleosa]|uniref:Non-specific lipid-transfer protein Lac s 1 n=1 Tax=Camellia lanceoleosa TaxID=1840588 RepID=A0ACC0J6T7_9ERIC|nr:Non-specific lipid-transfer protein Lac s 1 [Camellia lanceoleosa]
MRKRLRRRSVWGHRMLPSLLRKEGGAMQCCNGVRAINSAAQTPNDRKQTCVCLQQASKSITGCIEVDGPLIFSWNRFTAV